MNKHTPGPWKIGAGVFADRSGIEVNNVEHDQVIALVVDQDNGAFIEPDELRSNARLIAAAPELLEACKYFEEILEHALSDAEKLALPNSVVNIGSLMRAAIAKATCE